MSASKDDLLLFEFQQSLAALNSYGVNMRTSQDAIHKWCAQYARDVVEQYIVRSSRKRKKQG